MLVVFLSRYDKLLRCFVVLVRAEMRHVTKPRNERKKKSGKGEQGVRRRQEEAKARIADCHCV